MELEEIRLRRLANHGLISPLERLEAARRLCGIQAQFMSYAQHALRVRCSDWERGGEGLVKIIAGREYGEVLGMHIIGPRATDLICEGALAIGSELTLDELAATIHSHPTVTETMRECALDALGRAVHIPPRRK